MQNARWSGRSSSLSAVPETRSRRPIHERLPTPLLTIGLALAAAASSSPAAAGEDDATRSVVRAAALVESADRAGTPGDQAYYLRLARTVLWKVRTNHPDTAAAAAIATGQGIGTLSLERIDKRLEGLDPCAGPTRPTYDCALARAEEMVDSESWVPAYLKAALWWLPP